MIGVLDYGMGNIASVINTLKYIGKEVKIISIPDDFREVTHLIIPGVGAYKTAMDNIIERGFISPINDFANSNKPILGICLGMQLLSTTGSEPQQCDGLNLIPGHVEKISESTIRIPHVGWNSLIMADQDHPLFDFCKKNIDYYFVHSYRFIAQNNEDILGNTDYGKEFTSIVAKGNIIGIQFHPEKSQKNGLQLLKNFISINA